MKTVLITGTSRGIGLALSKNLLDKGYNVIGLSRKDMGEEFAGREFRWIKLDLSDKSSVQQAHKDIAALNVQIDLLINNAGIGPDLGMGFPEEDSFQSTFDVNVKGTVFFTEGVIKQMKERAKLINISSGMGSISSCVKSSSVAYRMSKAALNMYSKILANRYNDSIKVATLHPGWVQTSISPSNVNAPLTPEQSATKIVAFIENDFTNGVFWDIERNTEIDW